MVTYSPPELKDQLIHAKAVLEQVGRVNFFVLDEDFDPEDHDDEVTVDTDEVRIDLHEALETAEVTVGEMLRLAECLEKGRLVDKGTIEVPGETIFFVEPVSERAGAFAFMDDFCRSPIGSLGISASEDTKECEVLLTKGFSPFNLFAVKELDCSSTFPSYGEHYVYAVVSYDGELSSEKARAICSSYLFQLATCHDIVFTFGEFPDDSHLIDYNDYDDPPGPEEDGASSLRIRPADISRGMPELHELYLQGANANSTEWAFVSFAKTIEFVSMTVIKRTAHSEVRARLMVPEALKPDAPYIEGLIQLIGQQKEYGKQKEYIRRTLDECCDATRIVELLPPYLTPLAKNASSARDMKPVIAGLCDAIVDTRNYLVHAKAAYGRTGKECPDGELQQFTECVREIAFQAVVWYQSLPEHARVTEDAIVGSE